MKKGLYELSVEVTGISRIISGLSNQLSDDCDHLTPESLSLALLAVVDHLDRITSDMDDLL